MIKSIAIATAVVILSAGMASAKPNSHYDGARHHGKHQTGKVTLRERFSLARQRANLARLTRQIRSDGIVTRREKQRLKAATIRYKVAVRQARRS